MIEIIRKQGGKCIPIGLEEFSLSSMNWVNVVAPTEEEFSILSRILKVPIADIKGSVSMKEDPRVEYKDGYTHILIKAVQMKQVVSTSMIGIFIRKKTLVCVRKYDIENIPNAKDLADKFMQKDINFLLFKILSALTSSYDNILDKIEDQIDMLEEHILKKAEKDVVSKSYTHKKGLIFMRKALKNNSEVLKELKMDHEKRFKTRLFDDLVFDNNRMMDLEEVNRDRLSEIVNLHISTVSNNLNGIMKSLTLLAAIVAIPMLITGIYGMNFHFDPVGAPYNMPETRWRFGYLFALFLMLFSVSVTVSYLKFKKYI